MNMDGTVLNFLNLTQQTATPIEGLQIVVGEGEVFNHVDKNDFMWDSEGDRVIRQSIIFDQPFGAVPLVSVGLSGVDASRAQNQRFHLSVENITCFGFNLVFVTWGDTKIARASASWNATGSQKRKMRAVEDIETLFHVSHA